tara:strand:- start:565 stop:1554 length:990 start_codon:yes stop_codon:yes gene_type:complete
VLWAGYPETQATWEPESHISPSLLADYKKNASTVTACTRAAQERADSSSRELSSSERSLLLDSKCPVPKQWQSNTPNGGFFSRTWGLLVFNRSCVQVVDFDELFGSESLSQVVFALLKLLHDCPGLLDALTCLAYDDACHLLKFLELRGDVPQYAELTGRVDAGKLAVFVDVAHFDVAHKNSDTYCRTFTNPHLPRIAKLRKNQNGEAAEQSNAWLSRFKLIVRQMSPSRYRAFLLFMFWARNTRIVNELIFTAPRKVLAAQLVAHGVCTHHEASEAVRLAVAGHRARLQLFRSRLRQQMVPPPPPVRAALRVPIVAAAGFSAACETEK